MSKYILVDKLIAEIERRKNESRELAQEHKNSSLGNAAQTMANEDEEILSIIESLQQEQPETPFLTEKAIVWFNNIAESAKKLSAGNVSHLAPTIAGMAIRSAEFLEKRKQGQPEVPSGEDVMVMCNQILIDWVKEGNTQEEKELREQAHIRFFELYDDYLMREQLEVDLKEEFHRWLSNEKEEWGGEIPNYGDYGLFVIACHFAKWGATHFNARKQEENKE